MAARYTADEKKVAKAAGQKLVTIDAGGLDFSGPVTVDEQREVAAFLLGFLDRRAARIEAEETD